MTWRTHVAGGIASLWLLQPLQPWIDIGSRPVSPASNIGLLAIVAGLGALLPDLDAAESKIKHLRLGPNCWNLKPLWLPALLLHRTLGHRGPLHSFLGLFGVFLLIGLPLGLKAAWPPAFALLLGYASHLVLDACTKSGIPLLWPNRQRLHVLPPFLRVTTGSMVEEIVAVLLGMLALALLLPLLLTPNQAVSPSQQAW